MKTITLSIATVLMLCYHQNSHAEGKIKSEKREIGTTNQNCTDTLIPYLTSLDINYYKGKPVDSFLVKLPVNYLSMRIHSMDNSRYATYLFVNYADTVQVLIFVKEFHYLTPRNHNLDWDINLFRKEAVACIEVRHRWNRLTPECKYWE
ncbi:MAG: hypothetical protein JNM88_00430 [Chitinophagaceae bacterium]|nr:hypothetical protein [Chitinophagaceae bacterium]